MNKYQKYAPPPAIDSLGNFINVDKELLKYIQDGLENEKALLRSFKGYKSAEACMSILKGDTKPRTSTGPSKLQINKSRRQTKELIANQSDIRQNWKIRTTKVDDELYQAQSERFNDLSNHWWYNLFVDRSIKETFQLAGGHGTGYIHLWPDHNILTNEIDIIPTCLDYKQVLVSHIPKDNDIYKAYRVDIWMEYPLPIAHEKFPDHIDLLIADRGKPSWIARSWEQSRRAWRGVIDRVRNNPSKLPLANDPFPAVDVFYSFIKDESINTSGKIIAMGDDPLAHWYYEVPSYYDEKGEINTIGTNTFEDIILDKDENKIDSPFNPDGSLMEGTKKEKKEIKRYITRKECKLYPKRRLIISCSRGIIYDGPPHWGDGIPPVVQFYFDKITGEFLGFSPIMDTRSIGDSVDNIMRAMEDMIQGRVNPPIGISDKAPDNVKQTIKKLGARGLIGKVFSYNVMVLKEMLVSLVSSDYYKIDQADFEFLKLLQNQQDYVAGTGNIDINKLKQMPGADTQEAALESLGVLVTDQARELERSFMMLGRLWLSFASQVYTLKKRLQILEPKKAFSFKELDFDPSSIAPKKLENDSRPRWKIMDEHMKNFSIYVSPNSVQERQSMTNKLSLLQVQKSGVPISSRKVYDTIIGDDEFTKTEAEFYDEQEKKAIAAAKINVEVQKIMQAAQGSQQGQGNGDSKSSVLQQLLGELKGAIGEPENQIGRPNSNEASPQLEAKKDNQGIPRSTVSTS